MAKSADKVAPQAEETEAEAAPEVAPEPPVAPGPKQQQPVGLKLRDALRSPDEKASLRILEQHRSHERTLSTMVHHLGSVAAPLRFKLRRADASGSGSLTEGELSEALSSFGVHLEDGQIESLMDRHAVDEEHPLRSAGLAATASKTAPLSEEPKKDHHSRYRRHMRASYGAPLLMDYEKMVNEVEDEFERHESEELRAKNVKRSEPPRTIQRAWRMIERAGGVDNECWSRAFSGLDLTSSGTVPTEALPTVLSSLGLHLSEREMGTVLSIVDPERSGRVKYDDVQANATRQVAALENDRMEKFSQWWWPKICCTG